MVDRLIQLTVAALTSPWFLGLVVPLAVAFIAISLKTCARKTGTPPSREDFLIVFDLGLTAIATLFAVMAKAAGLLQILQAQLGATEVLSAAQSKELSDKIGIALKNLFVPMLLLLVISAALVVVAVVTRRRLAASPEASPVLPTWWIVVADIGGIVMLSASIMTGGGMQ